MRRQGEEEGNEARKQKHLHHGPKRTLCTLEMWFLIKT